ncbi:MAG: hypothetical protein L0229_30760 [Blastocatellia bacterium]|nr:hypothetical protein [Blastocatellia bacterium]
MYRFLDEEFWRDEFVVREDQVTGIEHYLIRVEHPVPEKELAEILVRYTLEIEEDFAFARVYSPEQVYGKGEKLAFIRPEGILYGEILNVRKGSHAEWGHYDKIDVCFEGEDSWHPYVSNCPALPLRFVGTGSTVNDRKTRSDPITPGQLVMQYQEPIFRQLRHSLASDDRFVCYEGTWFLSAMLVPVNLEHVEECLRLAREPLPANVILDKVLPGGAKNMKQEAREFSLAFTLEADKKHRFKRLDHNGKTLWALHIPAPPKESRFTVTTAALREGYIHVQPGLEQILNFYQLGPDLNFTVYGGYKISGELDPSTNRIYGTDIAQWYAENQVRVGEVVHVMAPNDAEGHLRLYSTDERNEIEEPSEKAEKSKTQVFLRNRIFKAFLKTQSFLHYREIASMLSSDLGKDITPGSVEAALSQAQHLFAKLGPSRGLWGLREWLTENYDVKIDLTALLLDIGELQLVHKVLREHAHPMSAKDIAQAMAGAYGIGPNVLLQANFIDPQDPRLTRLGNGLWALTEWRERWEKEARKINEELDHVEHLIKLRNEEQFSLSKVELLIDTANADLEQIVRTHDLLEENHNTHFQKLKSLQRHLEKLGELTEETERQGVAWDLELNRCVKRRRSYMVTSLLGEGAGMALLLTYSMTLGSLVCAISAFPLFVALRNHLKQKSILSQKSCLTSRRHEAKDIKRDVQPSLRAIQITIEKTIQDCRACELEKTAQLERVQRLEMQRREIQNKISDLTRQIAACDESTLRNRIVELAELLRETPEG